ncbi:MAG: DUF4249 domain-containing protein [Bacteroidota bacterium]|nr:DUF4249 domain-containing protein [Bacteroidota bacterium]
MKYYTTSFLTTIKWLPFLIVSMAVFSSCQKVIHIDLNSAEKKYVIEAIITDQPGTAQVLITQTKNFEEDNNFPGISGAIVTISENGGNPVTLTESSPGKYEATTLTGTSGKTYSLSVSAGGKTFTAVSTMPQKVNLDTIFVTDELLFTDTRKIVNTVYHDPPGRGNNYRFIQYINNKKGNQIIINNDDYTDGRTVYNKLFYFPDDNDSDKIKSGDTVRIDMLCIDANIYKYWFSLDRSSTGGSGQATPSNPVSNLQGGALGYFSAHTLQTKTMLVP